MRDHTKLQAFQLADTLAQTAYKATRDFPKSEVFGLTSQIRRAAVSVPANIVEGCARATEADYMHFLTIAYGSARELEYLIDLSNRLGYLADAEEIGMLSAAERVSRVLNGLIRSLRGS